MKTTLRILFALTTVFTVLIAYAYFTSNIDPKVWQPLPNPGLVGEFAANDELAKTTLFVEGVGEGPEDVAKGPDDWFYTGLADGRILRFKDNAADSTTYEEFVNTGGRPLGLQFDKAGNLIVADSGRGLIAIAPDKTITVLVDSINGKKMTFVDDLDIASDGTIWFSDATQRHRQETYIYDLIESRPTGRLLSYKPKTGETKVHIDNLFFANGVALGPDEQFVLINETGAARIKRLWLAGAKRGQVDDFYAGLPGHPDNISFNGKDTFWVALPAIRLKELESLAGDTFTRRLLGALPPKVLVPKGGHAMILGLGVNGDIKYNFQDSTGHVFTITSVNEFDGKLYLGSIAMHFVAMFNLENNGQ